MQYFQATRYASIMLAVALWAFGMVTPHAGAQVPDRDLKTLDDRSGEIELVIPTVNGRIVWKDVAASLAGSLKLDPATVEKIFPTGSLDLNSGATVFALLGIDIALGDAVSISMVRDQAGDPALRLRCDRNAIRFLSSKHDALPAAIDLDDDWQQRSVDRPLVICLHGMRSDEHRFDDFRAFLRGTGHATAAVSYDDRQSIVTSAEQMSELAAQVFVAPHQPELVLVGHSMGGLVAREWTENPELNNAKVIALITAGTPHRGSNWASLPPLLGMFADRKLDASDIVDVLLHEPSAPGMRQLSPESEFLTKLQSRPRRPDVQYTTIAGTDSPVTEEQVTKLRELLQRLNEQSTTLRLLQPRIRPLLTSFDELVDGKGDGIVAVARATIEGVDDVVLVDVTHIALFRRPLGRRVQPVWTAVEQRLSRL
jgi:pimeloyl-ACP methyl ester carboxylesterase